MKHYTPKAIWRGASRPTNALNEMLMRIEMRLEIFASQNASAFAQVVHVVRG
jgi:hypothetical protein